MRVALRIVAIVGAVAAVAIVVLAIVIATIDVNSFAGLIRERVKAATGRDLEVGSIALKRSPTPVLILDDVALANAAWGKAPALIAARQLEIEIKLLPLLHRQIEIERVVLVAPAISLETDAAGHRNWHIERPSSGNNTGLPNEGGSVFGALSIGQVAVRDGTLTWSESSGRTIDATIAELAIAAKHRDAPIQIAYRGDIDAVPVALQGELGPYSLFLRSGEPHPVKLAGDIAGRNVALAMKLTTAQNRYRAEALEVKIGGNVITGALSLVTGGPRPAITFDLSADNWSTRDGLLLPSGSAPSPPKGAAKADNAARAPKTEDNAAAKGTAATSRSNDLAVLRTFDARGDLAIGKLAFAGGQSAERVRAHVDIENGRADLSELTAATLGGTMRGRLTIDAREAKPQVTLRGEAKQLDLAALLALMGTQRDVKGGKTDITADLNATGDTARQWAGSASGQFTAIIGPATLVSTKGGPPPVLAQLADAIGPLRGADAATELTCAVVRLPLAAGVARVDRTIAFESRQVGVAASGTVDLRNETIDLAFKVNPREGIPIDVAKFSDLVRLRGPFNSPQVVLDPKGSATVIARLGAAYASGGLSMLGETIISKATAGGECDTALGRAPAQRQQSASAPPPPNAQQQSSPADEIAKSIGRLFKR